MRSPFLGRGRDRDRAGKPAAPRSVAARKLPLVRSHPEDEDFRLEEAEPEPELQPVHPKEFRRLLDEQKKPSASSAVSRVGSGPDFGVKLREGFQGLNSVLHGIDQKLAEHNRNSGALSESVRDLPEIMRDLPHASRTGVELLGGISQAIQSQNQLSRDLVGRVQDLADKVREIPVAVSKIADRLEESEKHRERLDGSLQDVRRSVTDMQGESIRLQERTLEEFRSALSKERSETRREREADQAVLREVVERTGRQSQVMNFLLILLILSAGTAITLFAIR